MLYCKCVCKHARVCVCACVHVCVYSDLSTLLLLFTMSSNLRKKLSTWQHAFFFANLKVIVKNKNQVLQTEIMLKIWFATRLPFISTGLLSCNVLFAAIDMTSCTIRSMYSLNRKDTDYAVSDDDWVLPGRPLLSRPYGLGKRTYPI